MKVNTTNTEKVQAVLDEAQGRCRTRLVDAADVVAAVGEVEATLAPLPIAERRGARFNMTDGTGRSSFASSYNGRPETTWVAIERGATAWFVVDAKRGDCGRDGAVQHITLSTAQQETLVRRTLELSRIESLSDDVLEAGSGLTPPARLAELAVSEVPKVRWTVAGNPNTPAELLTRLASDENPSVCSAVAEQRNLPPQALEVLARSGDVGAWRLLNLPAEKLTPRVKLALELAGPHVARISEDVWAQVDAAYPPEREPVQQDRWGDSISL